MSSMARSAAHDLPGATAVEPVARALLLVVAAALGAAAFLGLPLAWDGSYYLFNMLSSGGAFVPHQRLINAPLQAPALLASLFTHDPNLLQVAFGLGYAAVPFLALLACWWIVRRSTPALFIWPVIGIGLLGLPGQANMTSEAMLAVQLAWPIVMAIAVGLTRRNAGFAMGCAAAIIFTHPIAVPLLGGGAVALIARGWWLRDEREETWIWAAGFCCLTAFALFRFLIFQDVYGDGQLSISMLRFQFESSIVGAPAVALALSGVAMVAASAPAWIGVRRTFILMASTLIASLLVVGVGTALLAWAVDPQRWERALEFRGWYLWLSLPCMAVAFVEGTRLRAVAVNAQIALFRTWLALLIAAVMAVVLVVQGIAWAGVTGRLASDLRASPTACVSASSLSWTESTPMHHWSITPLGMVLQGERPLTLILDGSGCETADLSTGFPIGDFDRRTWSNDWFNLRILERLIQLQSSAASGR